MNPARRFLLFLMAVSAAMPWAVQAQSQSQAPRIVASFSILADIVREVAPPDFEVSALVGPNADAHVFQPSPADGRRLARADLVVVNGLGFEGWIDRLVRVSGYKGVTVVASKGIKPRNGGHHGTDPHAWQDLAHARRYVENIAEAIARRWPDRRAEVLARTDAYLQKIQELDRKVRRWVAAVPPEKRRVITSHDAFGYLGDAYGIEFLAVQGWSTSSEPSAAAVARLVRQIRKHAVTGLFVENISDPRLMEQIVRESGASVGKRLYSDALSEPASEAGTYLKMFEHNMRTLTGGLGSQGTE